MDPAKPIAQSTYDKVVHHISTASEAIFDLISKESVQEEKEITEAKENQENAGLTVSGDGSWRKRGFNSLYGVTTIIGYYTGKVLDLFISSKTCKTCEQWTGLEGITDYEVLGAACTQLPDQSHGVLWKDGDRRNVSHVSTIRRKI